MRKSIYIFSLFTLLILSGAVNTAVCQSAAKSGISIIPAPVKLRELGGSYQLSNKMTVRVTGLKNKSDQLEALARRFVSGFRKTAHGTAGQIHLRLTGSGMLPQEGYKLVINDSGINIESKSERGLFYGLQTLLQLPDFTSASIPKVEIEDYPRYKYRGLHLDVGRHMFPVSFIKSYIDVIAKQKLNTFHWHLTEDQGWRIEIKKYPKLTSIGGYRDETLVGYLKTKPQQYDGTRYGGFYTQQEVKEVVAYAASRFVDVIPEIEMPGHSVAALAAYPDLGCGENPGPYKVIQKWGVFEDVYCAGKERTFKFMEDVLDEVLALFPSQYIHIGGDECPKTKWKTCPDCQNRIKSENLKDEHELQSYFIQRIERYLNKKGRRIIGWDEILEGGLAPNATVMSWRGIKGGIEAARQNHDVIMTPGSHLYLDHQSSKSEEEPLTVGHYLPLDKVYAYNPTPAELNVDQQKHVIGVQANVWTEYIKTPQKVWYMLLPRLYALSEIAWTPLENKNWSDFSERRLPVHLASLDAEGIRFRVPEPIGAKDTVMTGEKFTFNYKVPVRSAKIYYTINGYTPYEMDYEYSGPFSLTVPPGQERIVKSVVITPSGKRSVVVKTILRNQIMQSAK